MKRFVTLAFLVFVLVPSFASAFSRDLFVGIRGPDVRDLQILLNRNPATQVARSGPGSPGLETQYFGPLTEDAVRRFQEVHRADILAPLGLGSPTGYFGPSSRVVASRITTTEVAGTFSQAIPATPVIPQNVAVGPVSVSPNANNDITALIAGVRAAGISEGYSEERLQVIEREIRSIAATTTNLIALFGEHNERARATGKSFEELKRDVERQASRLLSFGEPFREPFAALLAGFRVAPEAPLTQSALLPFGGPIVAAIPCTCEFGALWKVTVGPPRPVIADYVVGTQAFLSYNLPLTGINSLGFVAPGPQLCLVGALPFCVLVPGAGVITPIVGSSLIPTSGF